MFIHTSVVKVLEVSEAATEMAWCLELQTKVHTKVRNHGDGPYLGLLLAESSYYHFHILLLLSLIGTLSARRIGAFSMSVKSFHKPLFNHRLKL